MPPDFPPRLDTGRTWRDLPPMPPTEEPPRSVVPEAPAVPQPAASSPRWPWILGALGAVAAGVLVGMIAFGDSPPGFAATPSPSTTTVPPSEQIVPAPPPELGGPQPAPEDQPFGDLGDLGRQLEEFFGGEFLDELRRQFEGLIPEGGLAPPTEDFGLDLEGIVSVPEPPAGYSVTANELNVNPGGVQQRLVLSGNDGDIVVTAVRTSEEIPNLVGESVSVRGTTGVLREADGRLMLSWSESDLVTVMVEAPSGFGTDALIDLAESLEVAP